MPKHREFVGINDAAQAAEHFLEGVPRQAEAPTTEHAIAAPQPEDAELRGNIYSALGNAAQNLVAVLHGGVKGADQQTLKLIEANSVTFRSGLRGEHGRDVTIEPEAAKFEGTDEQVATLEGALELYNIAVVNSLTPEALKERIGEIAELNDGGIPEGYGLALAHYTEVWDREEDLRQHPVEDFPAGWKVF